jgi:hypothetical protein
VHPIRSNVMLALTAFWVLAVSAAAGNAPAKPTGETAEVRAIQATFSQYKEALLNSDGSKAAEVLSARTIAFYGGIARHALSTSRADLGKLDFITKLMVVRIRHEFTRAQISSMTGRELLVIGVNNGGSRSRQSRISTGLWRSSLTRPKRMPRSQPPRVCRCFAS